MELGSERGTTPDKQLRLYKIKNYHPTFKLKSSIVSCIGTNIVFLFGGFDDLDDLDSNVYLLDTCTMKWEVDDSHKHMAREGHLAVYIGQGNVVVLGGIPEDEFIVGRNDSINNRLMISYNIFQRKWTSLPDPPDVSVLRTISRHSCCLSPNGDIIYISGGLVDSCAINDLYAYNLITEVWSGPYKFVHRFNHTITISGNKLFSFGGLDKNMNHVKDKVSFFDLYDHSTGEISLTRNHGRCYGEEDSEDDKFYRVLSYGDRFYLDSGVNQAIKLELGLTLSGFDPREQFNISYYDLDKLKYVALLEQSDLDEYFCRTYNEDFKEYEWKYVIISNQKSLLLIGNNRGDKSSSIEDEINLNAVLEIGLNHLGIFDNQDHLTSLANTPNNTLANDFLHLLLSESYTDYEIYAVNDPKAKDKHLEINDSYDIYDEEIFSNPNVSLIKVHKHILIARWSHFQRLIDSGMSEAKSNRLFIPEPISWVKVLILYLYTGNIEFDRSIIPSFTLHDYSGLLILANYYELVDLRSQVLAALYKGLEIFISDKDIPLENEFQINSLIKIWFNISMANEAILIARMSQVLKRNWSILIKSETFSNLSKEVIVRLCQQCSTSFPGLNDGKTTPKRSSSRLDIVFGSNELITTVDSMERDSKSPLSYRDGVLSNRSSEDGMPHLPALQHLSNILNDHIDQ